MGIRLSNRVGYNSAVQSYPFNVFSRTGDYPVEECEAQVVADSSNPGFHFRANRGPYAFFNETWPSNSQDGRPTRDYDVGRMTAASWKSTGSWAQVAAGGVDGLLISRGNEIAAWFDARPDADICVSFHHEPNNGDSGTSAEWRAATERMWTIWTQTCGVPIWEGSQDGVATSHGAILVGPVWANGAFALPAGQSIPMFESWMPDSWTWGWQNVKMLALDAYNAGPTWRAFEETMGGLSSRPGFKIWCDQKQAEQNALGRVCFASIWETGVQERNEPDPVTGNPRYTGESTYFTSNYGTATKPHWIEALGTYLTNDWPELHSLHYWDSQVVPPGGRGPYMTDTSQASWDAFVALTQLPVFEEAGPPPPPPPPPTGGVVDGAVSYHQRARFAYA